MVDNINKAFSDLTDPNRVINTEGFGTDFVKIAEQSSEDLEELGITSDDIAPKYSYPLLIDEEYPIKLVFTAYEIDFTKSKQWDAIEKETDNIRKIGKDIKDDLLENPDKLITATGGALAFGGAGFLSGKGGLSTVATTAGGAALGGAITAVAVTGGSEAVESFAGSVGNIISQGSKLTSYDNYSASTDPRGTVTLPLQRGLQYGDKVSYNQQSTNFGQGVISAASSVLSGEGGDLNDAAMGSISRMVARLTGAAAGGAALGLSSKLRLGGAIAGAIGAEPLANFAKEVSRTSINPNLRTLFDNVPMRGFQFPFRMVAKSEKEAKEIKNIVKFFRAQLYPEAVNAGENGDLPFAYKFPNVFDIQLKDSTGKNPAFKIQRCYLTGVNATFNQTATGMYKGKDGNYFIEVDMSLEFIEIVTMDKKKVEEGGF